MNIKKEIENLIRKALKNIGLEADSILLDHPSDSKMGDYSTNIAMALAKKQGMNPKELAEKIITEMSKGPFDRIEKVEVAGPGFINFYLSREFFSNSVKEILEEKENWGKNELLEGKKIIIEYTVTNVLKPMHIGHLMGNVIGESLSRIIAKSGAEIKRNNYQGDSGLHVAKAVWGIQKLSETRPIPIEGTLSEKSNYIGSAYELGSSNYSLPECKGEIDEVNQKIFGKTDQKLLDIYEWGRQVSLDHFEELYKKLGTKFDLYFFESEVADNALKIVREFLKQGIFTESDGAIVFEGQKYNPKLHTRVFITKQNLPTYEAKDIAHAIRKYDAYKFDQAIIVTANEQDEYFKVVLCALDKISPEIASRMKHLSHGLLKLGGEKMGSRKGNVITGEGLINAVYDRVLLQVADRDFSGADKNKISEIVAISAIKYSILRQSVGGDILFDFDKMLSFEGDSGPYLQYTAVRANSIMKKAETLGMSASFENAPSEVSGLEQLLYQFPEVVARALTDMEPHHIVTYLTELASSFNSFYANNIVLDEGSEYSAYRLAIVEALYQTMKNGLYLLGIETPEKM